MDLIEIQEEPLTKKQESICETTGVFGVLISLTCLIQQLVFMNPHWITYCVTVVYILSGIGFGLLAKKSVNAFPLIIVSCIFVFLLNILLLLIFAFSLAILLLFLYSLAIIILLKTYDVQTQLKRKVALEKEEQDKWNGVIY